MTDMVRHKPLGGNAYGSIAHLPSSRMGPGDHHITDGQARICCVARRDSRDHIIVQEKVDGSCTAVAQVEGHIIALGRVGYLAETSPFEQHHMFAAWVQAQVQRGRFALLRDGERLVGEWLAQAHGTRYALPHEPWVVFDLMAGHHRLTVEALVERCRPLEFVHPRLISAGPPLSVSDMVPLIERSGHGALDPVEGAVWRVERNGEVDFLAKWVRPEKADGLYLPEVSGGPPVWNWRP